MSLEPNISSDTRSAHPLQTFLRGFVEHPASVDETYVQHFRFALGFAAVLFAAGCAALVHALVPPLFETTASRMVKRLHARLDARH